jgi:NAD(P)-dependent dehydrogenase (short-subunit alcohol dehydrogenase family)
VTLLEVNSTEQTRLQRMSAVVRGKRVPSDLDSRDLGDHGLAGLVNIASLIVERPFELVPVDDLRHQFEVNVIGQFAVTQAFIPLLRRGKGRVINVGAVRGRVAIPFLGPISASKAALASLTDVLRMESKPWGIAVSD